METLRDRDRPMRSHPDACGMGQRHPRVAGAQGGGRHRPGGPRAPRARFHARQSPCYPLNVASNISAAGRPMRPSLPPRCSFPATMRITGVDFFRAMARFHVRAKPPTSPLLFEYGRDFPDFIERYEYARSMPWLADVARLQGGRGDAFLPGEGGAPGAPGFGANPP